MINFLGVALNEVKLRRRNPGSRSPAFAKATAWQVTVCCIILSRSDEVSI